LTLSFGYEFQSSDPLNTKSLQSPSGRLVPVESFPPFDEKIRQSVVVNQKPIAVDVLFKANPMVLFSG
jgi:hypothetical protein